MSKIILVSSCLVGIPCRYCGRGALNPQLLTKLSCTDSILLGCPELLGGLPTPRPACNIVGGTGLDVLEGRASVLGVDGTDYTTPFVTGCHRLLEIVRKMEIREAWLKSKSPSCGCGEIYAPDGKNIVHGDGILTALLKQNGIVVNEVK